jgi:hypothetical protein
MAKFTPYDLSFMSRKTWTQLRDRRGPSTLLGQINMPTKLLALVLLLVSTTAEASYFVDAPPISIDEYMEGCFADKACAAQAERLIPLFATSKGMTETEVRETLHSCISPDRNMGFCVMYEIFALEDELKDIVRTRLQKKPQDKLALPVRDIEPWSERVRGKCMRQIEKEEPEAQGLYFSELTLACRSNKVRTTLKKLR